MTSLQTPRARSFDDTPQPGADLGEAVRRYFTRWRVFSGRASRAEYWHVALLQLVVSGGFYVVARGLEPAGAPLGVILLVAGLLVAWVLVTLVPSLALNARRLHDANLSGWWQLVCLVPYVGSLVMAVLALLPSNAQGERFDRVRASVYGAYRA